MSIFIDTSGFIAVLDKDDASHSEAVKTWMDILTSEETLVTTNSGSACRKSWTFSGAGVENKKGIHVFT